MCERCEEAGFDLHVGHGHGQTGGAHGDALFDRPMGLDLYGTPVTVEAALPVEVYAAATNPYGKQSFTYDQAAVQISRRNNKWDDQDAGTGLVVDGVYDDNALGTPGTVTYGYVAQADISDSLPGVEDAADHRALTAAEIANVDYAISLISEVANITFTRVDAGGDGYLDSTANAEIDIIGELNTNGGYASTPAGGGEIFSSLVNIGVSGLASEGSYAFSTALHEVGHAIGMPHPGDYNASEDEPPNYADNASYFEDSRQYSFMSYWSERETGAEFQGRYAINTMLHDIAALHRLYGANTETRDTATTYGFNSNTGDRGWTLSSGSDYIIGAIWDAGGRDRIDASGYANDQVIDLRQESFSSLGGRTYNLAIARGVMIEEAVGGTGDDLLIANSGDASFYDASQTDYAGRPVAGAVQGYDGSNYLDGGAGDDTVSFEAAVEGVDVDLGDASGVFDLGANGIDTLVGIENLIGSDFADRLVGTGGDNLLDGGLGDDTIVSGGGVDRLYGGEGNDLVDLSAAASAVATDLSSGVSTMDGVRITLEGFENVIGTAFGDEVVATDDDNTLDGGAGDDTLVGFGGDDTIVGGAGNDVIYGDSGGGYEPIRAEIDGTDGDDLLTGNIADNTIRGFAGNDTLTGREGNDTLDGGLGNDSLDGGLGDDSLDGGDGNDTLRGGDGNDLLTGQGTVLAYGDAGDDTLLGAAAADALYGGAGADRIEGGAGGDVLDGGDGADTLLGGDGSDTLDGGAGADRIEDTEGSNTVRAGDQDDYVLMGAGFDLVYGGSGDDDIYGNAGSDTLYGEDGTDYISAGDGADSVFGGGARDYLNGGLGADTIDGGDGDDFGYYYFSEDGVSVNLATGATAFGHAAGDVLISIENLFGSDGGADTLIGDAGENYIEGFGGDDSIDGGAGDDILFGNAGSDRLTGGAGDDILRGGGRFGDGAGTDTLFGGAGADEFQAYSGEDDFQYVGDFEDGIDTIGLAQTGTASFAELTITEGTFNFLTGVFIDYGDAGNDFFLAGVSAAQLTAADFGFA